MKINTHTHWFKYPIALLAVLLMVACTPFSKPAPTSTPIPPPTPSPVAQDGNEDAGENAGENAGEGAGEGAGETETPTVQALATPEPTDISLPGGNMIMTLGLRDPPTLDPALVGDTTSAFVVQQLFSGLVKLDNNLDIQPDLAERWSLSDDKRTYTFTLRQDARFADGTPITTEDVRYSLERATDPALARFLPAQAYLTDIVGVREKLAGTASEISGIEVLDDDTIALTIDRPKSYFLSKLVHPTAYVIDHRAVEAGGETWTEQPNGSGPFVIEEWEHDRTLVIMRNVNYYGNLARLDRVTLLMGAAASNPLVLYEQGKIDVTYVGSFALDRVRDENNPLSKELVSSPQLSLAYMGMNTTIPPFDDPKVRQAFTMLIDRERLAEVTLNGSAIPARGILPPGMPGYNPDLPEPEADIEQAKQLLRESTYGGAENLPPVVIYGDWAGVMRDIAEEELGINVEVRSFESFGEFLDELNENEIPMFGTGWVADYPDPENFLDLLFRSGGLENHMAYANPDVDALLDEAASERDEERRWELYREAEKMILADAPVIPLYHNVEYMLVKPYVKGLVLTPMDILDLSTVELIQ
jgi:ABC-type transport system substrate-binding protein